MSRQHVTCHIRSQPKWLRSYAHISTGKILVCHDRVHVELTGTRYEQLPAQQHTTCYDDLEIQASASLLHCHIALCITRHMFVCLLQSNMHLHKSCQSPQRCTAPRKALSMGVFKKCLLQQQHLMHMQHSTQTMSAAYPSCCSAQEHQPHPASKYLRSRLTSHLQRYSCRATFAYTLQPQRQPHSNVLNIQPLTAHMHTALAAMQHKCTCSRPQLSHTAQLRTRHR